MTDRAKKAKKKAARKKPNAAERGVTAAQAVFAKVLAKVDPEARRTKR